MSGPVEVEACRALSTVGVQDRFDRGGCEMVANADGFFVRVADEMDDEERPCLVRVPAGDAGAGSSLLPVLAVRRPRAVGGRRWLWRCPGCRAAVAVLLLPPGIDRLRCRGCHRAVYRSQRVAGNSITSLVRRRRRVYAALARARSLQRKAGLLDQVTAIEIRLQRALRKLAIEKIALCERVLGDEVEDDTLPSRKGSDAVMEMEATGDHEMRMGAHVAREEVVR